MELPSRTDLPDVTIKFDGKKFHAHRTVLETHSPVLKNLLENSKRQEINYLDEDVKPEIFDDIINYFYETEITLTLDNVFAYCSAACKLEVDSLLEKCREFFTDNVTTSNAVDLFMLSETLCWETIHNQCLKFLQEHYERALLQHESFNFIIEQIHFLIKQMTEDACHDDHDVKLRDALFHFSVRWHAKDPVARLSDFKSLLKNTNIRDSASPSDMKKYLPQENSGEDGGNDSKTSTETKVEPDAGTNSAVSTEPKTDTDVSSGDSEPEVKADVSGELSNSEFNITPKVDVSKDDRASSESKAEADFSTDYLSGSPTEMPLADQANSNMESKPDVKKDSGIDVQTEDRLADEVNSERDAEKVSENVVVDSKTETQLNNITLNVSIYNTYVYADANDQSNSRSDAKSNDETKTKIHAETNEKTNVEENADTNAKMPTETKPKTHAGANADICVDSTAKVQTEANIENSVGTTPETTARTIAEICAETAAKAHAGTNAKIEAKVHAETHHKLYTETYADTYSKIYAKTYTETYSKIYPETYAKTYNVAGLKVHVHKVGMHEMAIWAFPIIMILYSIYKLCIEPLFHKC